MAIDTRLTGGPKQTERLLVVELAKDFRKLASPLPGMAFQGESLKIADRLGVDLKSPQPLRVFGQGRGLGQV